MLQAVPRQARWPVWVGTVAGLCLLAWVLSRVDLARVGTALTQLDPQRLVVPLAITLGLACLRAWRWRGIFTATMRPGLWPCFRTLAIGNLTNIFLPGRGGDVLRCFLMSREPQRARTSSVLATVGVEKVLDGLLLLVIAALSSFVVATPEWFVRLEVVSALVFGGAFILLMLFCRRPSLFSGPVRWLLRILRLGRLQDKLGSLVASLVEGLKLIVSPWQMAGVVLLTVAIWIGEGALVWSVAWAMSLPLSPAGALVVSAVLGLGLSIPAAPGSIGTYEFFSVAGLTLFGMHRESAVALAVIMHGWSILATAGLALGAYGVELVRVAMPKMPQADALKRLDDRTGAGVP